MRKNLSIRSLLAQGQLHPSPFTARGAMRRVEAWTKNGASPSTLFMAQAHLFGCWAYLAASSLPRQKNLVALALTESDPAQPSQLLVSNTGFKLVLRKTWVTNGASAKAYLVTLHTPEGERAYYLPRPRGLKAKLLAPRWSLALVEGAQIAFDGPLPAGSVDLGPAPALFRAVMHVERAMIFASAPGLLERALALVEKEAREKKRGAARLSSSPRYQESRAEIISLIKKIRAEVEANAAALDSGSLSFIASAGSKARLSALSTEAAQKILQLAGKESLFLDSPVGEIFRDFWAGLFYSGPSDLLRDISKV